MQVFVNSWTFYTSLSRIENCAANPATNSRKHLQKEITEKEEKKGKITKMESEIFDVVIIGCGAVGAAVAREFTLLGQKCIVLEKNVDVIDEASSGNTGHLVIRNR